MKLYVFGSCSGTEPMENRHHTALAFEINGRLYWFDAGENCSHTAHTMGVDLLSVSDIFISHTHIDHIGGLGNLLWTIHKLSNVKKTVTRFGDINVYIPTLNSFDHLMRLYADTEGNFVSKFSKAAQKIADGVLLDKDGVVISALHNNHLPQAKTDFLSYSFCIKAEGKKIVYSGDLRAFDELLPLLNGNTDLLLMETGHHSAPDICRQIKEAGLQIKKVIFVHHGREILKNYDGVLTCCKEILPCVEIANDRDVYEL